MKTKKQIQNQTITQKNTNKTMKTFQFKQFQQKSKTQRQFSIFDIISQINDADNQTNDVTNQINEKNNITINDELISKFHQFIDVKMTTLLNVHIALHFFSLIMKYELL